MKRLITATEFASFRSISKKINEEKVNEAIDLAQASDLHKILGDFYFDVLENSDKPDFAELMDGSTFTEDGRKIIHFGIKAVLADFVYSRYIYDINVNLTPFGAHEKKTNDSSPIDRNTVKDLSKQAQIDAGYKFQTVSRYIYTKPDTFKTYCEKGKGATFNSIRISKL